MPYSPATAHQVDEIVAHAQSVGNAPALVVGVVRDGALVHVAVAPDATAPVIDAQSRIGSISKTLTAALVLGLRDDGRLALDEPIGAHLPGLAVGALTIRQLLGHVSGLRREPAGPWWERADVGDIDALLSGVGADAIAHPPFRTHHYSNLGYGLLGAAVSSITGTSWFDAIDTRLLTPLGMTRTTYAATAPFLTGYVVHPHDGTLREEPRRDAGAMAPAGQLWSTLADLATWAGFLADPVPSVLAPETVAEMCVPVAISDLESWTGGHGLGLELWRSGDRIYVGHTGSMPGYLALMMTHRPSRTAVVGFATTYTLASGTISGLGTRILDVVLDAEPGPPAPIDMPAVGEDASQMPADVVALLGTWWWMGRQHEATWDGDLVVTMPTRPSMTPWRFAPVGTGTNLWRGRAGMNDGEIMRVHRADDGTPIELDIATFVFTRDPWPGDVR